jgi:hypothetical protein
MPAAIAGVSRDVERTRQKLYQVKCKAKAAFEFFSFFEKAFVILARRGAETQHCEDVSMFHALQLRFVTDRIASYAMHGEGAMVLVNVMRIPCFGRRMTIGRASIIWPGAS